MDIRNEARKAAKAGKLLVLKINGRQPTEDEERMAGVLLVNGKVIKNRFGGMGSWKEVKADLLEHAQLYEVSG